MQVLDVSQAKGPIEEMLKALETLPNLRVLNLSDLHVRKSSWFVVFISSSCKVHPTYSREPFSPNLPYGVPCNLLAPLSLWKKGKNFLVNVLC